MSLPLFGEFYGLELFYLICGMVGGSVFLLRFVLLLFGLGDGDMELEPDMDMGSGEIIADADASFRILSVQGLASFLAIFGLTGLALIREWGVSAGFSMIGGMAAGAAMMFVVGQLTFWMYSLQSRGNLDPKKAVGAEGTVYMNIPAKGTGKAQVTFQNRLKVLEAVSADRKAINTGERVRVVEVRGGGLLVVEKV